MNYVADLYNLFGDYEERVAIIAPDRVSAKDYLYKKTNCEAAIVDIVSDREMIRTPFKVFNAE